ncbi:MAG TPA: beta-ketoacyl reductase, partial [Pyrinomonadaceae bacterium]
RPAAALDERTCREVLRPKTRGSLALWRAVEQDGPDFFAFFSSAISFFGTAGQGNYAAASTFQDAFALHLARRHGPAIKLFNWGFWGEVGAVASPVYLERVARHGVGSIGCGEGIEAFRLLMSGGVTQAMPIKISDATLSKMGLQVVGAEAAGAGAGRADATVRGTGGESAVAPDESPAGSAIESDGLTPATRARVAQTLREQVAAVVKLTPGEIRDEKPFSEYGVDSIMGADLVQRINVALGLELRPTVLFDHSCLRDLTTHVLAAGGGAVPGGGRFGPDDAAPSGPFQSTEELFGASAGADSFEPDRLDELLRQLADGLLDAEAAHRRLSLAGGNGRQGGGNGRHKGGVRS